MRKLSLTAPSLLVPQRCLKVFEGYPDWFLDRIRVGRCFMTICRSFTSHNACSQPCSHAAMHAVPSSPACMLPTCLDVKLHRVIRSAHKNFVLHASKPYSFLHLQSCAFFAGHRP